MSKTQTIFFDESGYTGNNLLNPDQPAFVYASVAIDPLDAAHLHSEMISKFNIKGKELKGKDLVKSERGCKAISWLIKECRDIANIVIANKKFALAGKFFEYTFEPVLKHDNELFYAVDFHNFIANLIYVLLESKDETTERLISNFENLMRTQDTSVLGELLTPTSQVVTFSKPLDMILTFCLCHKEKIKDEIKGLSEIHGVSRWALELTTTSLFWMLSHWSERFNLIDVYCDESKPLNDNRELFNVMIGRTDRIYMKLGSKPESPLTFNLTGPISLIDSQQSHGIQIADVLSSSIAFAFKNPENDFSKNWIKLAKNMFGQFNIVPNLEAINLHKRDPFINGLILHELVERTLKGQSLFIGMPEFISDMQYAYSVSPPPNSK